MFYDHGSRESKWPWGKVDGNGRKTGGGVSFSWAGGEIKPERPHLIPSHLSSCERDAGAIPTGRRPVSPDL